LERYRKEALLFPSLPLAFVAVATGKSSLPQAIRRSRHTPSSFGRDLYHFGRERFLYFVLQLATYTAIPGAVVLVLVK
jgi:hypothetical protein